MATDDARGKSGGNSQGRKKCYCCELHVDLLILVTSSYAKLLPAVDYVLLEVEVGGDFGFFGCMQQLCCGLVWPWGVDVHPPSVSQFSEFIHDTEYCKISPNYSSAPTHANTIHRRAPPQKRKQDGTPETGTLTDVC